ncbi:MAG: RsmE family RNA methyltransferase [Spirochaetaceae bacterium]|nr:RsmE family RNA methyltransferase [Spirochaetaceae bacterium]MDT8298609.1 RsmE family RNA methyltransferase [Spirochaetaceae bacterium]
MNLILFEDDELGKNLPFDDPRSIHIRQILKLDVGDEFKAGVIGGEIGIARLEDQSKTAWIWSFVPTCEPEPLHPLTLVLGCPRPPVAHRLLKDMSSIGIKELRCCTTDLNEKSYLTSKLWREGLWRQAVIDGGVQAGSTLLPEVRTSSSLDLSLDDFPAGSTRIALDNAPDAGPFGHQIIAGGQAVLAVGPERGWSDRERVVLDAHGFVRLHLGTRILRTETACSLGTGLMLSRMGIL